IQRSVVKDTRGRVYDVYASSTVEGRQRLQERAHASTVLANTRDLNSVGINFDSVVAFSDGESDSATSGTAVLITNHIDGEARSLDVLTIEDCASAGAAIGAVHRLNSSFVENAGYPVVSTGQIRSQLTQWIQQLHQNGHIPSEITTNWSNIIETEGLWSFNTCPVHGGYDNGDFLFAGSTITAVTNWQHLQVNDPARDLAWIFGYLDEQHRNALLSAYGRLLGSRLDNLIVLRANLWLQMEEVSEYMKALNSANNDQIMRTKARIERLAHQLNLSGVSKNTKKNQASSSTLTVGALLDETNNSRQNSDNTPSDETNEQDKTGSSQIPIKGIDDLDDSDSTNSTQLPHAKHAEGAIDSISFSLSTQAISRDEIEDNTNSNGIIIHDHTQSSQSSTQVSTEDGSNNATMLIPQQERESIALHNAETGLEEFQAIQNEKKHDSSDRLEPQEHVETASPEQDNKLENDNTSEADDTTGATEIISSAEVSSAVQAQNEKEVLKNKDDYETVTSLEIVEESVDTEE
ncbi:MAG: hypothetical protein Q3961_05300, partial [Bifidobacteriaceae bacterium]|nr:hypothetical protein [Bifidobacteriaceae bacterium]